METMDKEAWLNRLVAFDTTSCNSNLPLIECMGNWLNHLQIPFTLTGTAMEHISMRNLGRSRIQDQRGGCWPLGDGGAKPEAAAQKTNRPALSSGLESDHGPLPGSHIFA